MTFRPIIARAPGQSESRRVDLLRTKRIAWIDVARGMGIILVVYGHVLQGLVGAHLLSTASPLWLSDYTVYTFHMPLFFLLAGIHAKSSLRKGAKPFLVGKLWTVAYPYLLWSAVQGGVQLLTEKVAPGAVNYARSPLFMETVLFRPIAQFWFLYALFFCHILAPLGVRRAWMSGLIAGIAICLCVCGLCKPTSYMLPFYILGMLISSPVRHWQPGLRASVAQGLVCVAGFAAAIHFGRAASAANAESIYSLPATLLGLSLVLVLSQACVGGNALLTNTLTTLGGMSMTIYVLHGLADSGARFALEKAGLTSAPTQLLVGLLAGLSLPMIAHVLLARLNLLPAFGLAQLVRQRAELKDRHVEHSSHADTGQLASQ